MSGPSVEDAIAAVSRRHRPVRVSGGTATGSTWVCGCGETARTPGTRDWAEALHARHVAAAVVAAIRAMTAEQQAELIGGEVQRSGRTHLGASGLFEHEPVARLVGPWQETP